LTHIKHSGSPSPLICTAEITNTQCASCKSKGVACQSTDSYSVRSLLHHSVLSHLEKVMNRNVAPKPREGKEEKKSYPGISVTTAEHKSRPAEKMHPSIGDRTDPITEDVSGVTSPQGQVAYQSPKTICATHFLTRGARTTVLGPRIEISPGRLVRGPCVARQARSHQRFVRSRQVART
jgi:hypothetical protein